MTYTGYECLNVRVESRVAWVTIDHPPINLFDLPLIQEVTRVGIELERDPEVRVVVFQSADPEFFIAHADINLIMGLPAEPPQGAELGVFHAMVDRFRTMPKVTIGKLEGRARGGGSELLLGLDLRFASLEKAVLAQPEVSVGIIPGGGGTQRLPRLMGRARALEVVLGCLDYPAALAERYGYVNRALPQAELGPFVEKLALRIASFPAAGDRAGKTRGVFGRLFSRRGTARGGASVSSERGRPRGARAHGAVHGSRRANAGGRDVDGRDHGNSRLDLG